MMNLMIKYVQRNALTTLLLASVFVLGWNAVGCGEEQFPDSSDADLSDLQVSEGALVPAFDSNTTVYQVEVSGETSEIILTPYVSNEFGKVTINGVSTITGRASDAISLQVGSNSIELIVTAENGGTKTYTVNVIRASETGNSELLGGLNVFLDSELQSLTPAFDSETFSYACEVPFATETVEINASVLDASATLQIEGVEVSSNSRHAVNLQTGVDDLGQPLSSEFLISVTSGDAVTQQNYLLTVNRSQANDNTRLDALSLDGIVFTPEFDSDTLSYSAYTHFLDQETNVTTRVQQVTSQASVDGEILSDYTASGSISLNQGNNNIIVSVTAESGSVGQYAVDLHREPQTEIEQQLYIKSSNSDQFDHFGSAIAVHGNTLAIAARGESSNATEAGGDMNNNDAESAGAVYIFTLDEDNNWQEQAYLKASNSEEFDYFGHSIAIYGNTVAVGALREDSGVNTVNGDGADNSADEAGAVYIFERDNEGAWSQTAYLKASNSDAGDWFGFSLALYEDTLLVGAPEEDGGYTDTLEGDPDDNSMHELGAVYVFTRDELGQWSQQAYLKPYPYYADSGDQFGYSVAIEGDLAAVGAIDGSSIVDSNPLTSSKGSVVLFERAGEQWTRLQTLGPESGSGDFGSAVALSGNRLAVGDEGNDSSSRVINAGQSNVVAENAGAAWIYELQDDEWTSVAFIKPSNTDETDRFGEVLSFSGNLLAVGVTHEDSGATGINGDHLDNSLESAGAVYVFAEKSAGQWVQHAYVKASNTSTIDHFGSGLALSGNLLVVGAEDEDSASRGINGDQNDFQIATEGSGAVYLYDGLPSSEWILSVSAQGDGTGSISGIRQSDLMQSIDCGIQCSTTTAAGEVYLLTATADAGSEFSGWSGNDACSAAATGNQTWITPAENVHCIATFNLSGSSDVTLTLSKDPEGSGEGSLQAYLGDLGAIVNCDTDCDSATSEVLESGFSIDIYATPQPGYIVEGWSGDSQCSANASLDLTHTFVELEKTTTCTARFGFGAS